MGPKTRVVAAVSLLSVVAISASSAGDPVSAVPRATRATLAADLPVAQNAGTRIVEQPLVEQPSPGTATGIQPRDIITTRTGAPAPQTTATASTGRARARFDMDGDGRDELVVGGSADPGGFVLHVHYSGLRRRETLTAPATAEPRHNLSLPYTAGDFNGDGFQDLAVGSFRTPSPDVFERGIFVYNGSSAGLDRDNVTYLEGLHPGAFAAGDVDNDGKDELAVSDGGATAERDGSFRGSVTVLFGSATGLTKNGLVELRQVVPRWRGMVEDVFGGPSNPLAMGDFTGDGYADLAVGGDRRGESASDSHGIVTLFPGSAKGPDIASVTKLEGAIDFPSSFPVDVMAMADMNQDGREDLLLGLPRHKNGEVIYLPGATVGLSVAGLRLLDQDTPGIPGEPDDDPTGGHFGHSLATGDATGDGVPDLLVGAMTMTVAGVVDAGSVTLIPGTAEGPSGNGSFVYAQRAPSPRKPDPANPDPAEPDDYLGSSVAILDLDGAGPLEMFVESKYEDLNEETNAMPIGLITTLQLRPNIPRRGSSQPPSYRLLPVNLQRSADFADPGFQVLSLGSGLLSG